MFSWSLDQFRALPCDWKRPIGHYLTLHLHAHFLDHGFRSPRWVISTKSICMNHVWYANLLYSKNRFQVLREIDVFFVSGPLYGLASWLKMPNWVYRYSTCPIASVFIEYAITDFTAQNARFSRTDRKFCEKLMFSLSLGRFTAWPRDWKSPIGYVAISFFESHHFL